VFDKFIRIFHRETTRPLHCKTMEKTTLCSALSVMCNSRQILRPVMFHSMLIGLKRKLSCIDSAGSKFLSYPERPDRIWGLPSPPFMCTRRSVSGDKLDHSSRTRAQLRMCWAINPLWYIFMAWCLLNTGKLNILLLEKKLYLCMYVYVYIYICMYIYIYIYVWIKIIS
jgi:hypothetical protein